MSDSHNNVCSLGPTAVAYVSNDLPSEEMLEFEMHLASCKECFESVSELRRVRSLFQESALLRRLAGPTVVPVSVPIVASQTEKGWFNIQDALAICVQQAKARGDRLYRSLETWEMQLKRTPAGAVESACALIRSSAENVRVTWEAMREFGTIMFKQVEQSIEVPAFKAEGQVTSTRGERKPGEVDIQTKLQNGRLLVVIYGLPLETERLAIVLVPQVGPNSGQGSERKPQAKYAEKRNGGSWVAHFDDVMPGEHAVALAPLSSTANT